jgi:hypothetical protein
MIGVGEGVVNAGNHSVGNAPELQHPHNLHAITDLYTKRCRVKIIFKDLPLGVAQEELPLRSSR